MKITKNEKYNWDAGIDVSREDAIKFAHNILSLCDVKSCNDNDNIIDLLELDLLNNIKDGNLKYKFIDQLETYDDALGYWKDGWRLPVNVDILNIRDKLYDILGDKLFTFSLWSYVSAPYIGYRTSIKFYKTNNTLDYIITRNPEKYNKLIIVKDLS